MKKSVASSAKQQREITVFTVLITTWAFNRKSLILRILKFNSTQTNPVVGFFTNIVKCEQDETIAN